MAGIKLRYYFNWVLRASRVIHAFPNRRVRPRESFQLNKSEEQFTSKVDDTNYSLKSINLSTSGDDIFALEDIALEYGANVDVGENDWNDGDSNGSNHEEVTVVRNVLPHDMRHPGDDDDSRYMFSGDARKTNKIKEIFSFFDDCNENCDQMSQGEQKSGVKNVPQNNTSNHISITIESDSQSTNDDIRSDDNFRDDESKSKIKVGDGSNQITYHNGHASSNNPVDIDVILTATAATQTYFKQGFIPPVKKVTDVATLKRRRNSDPGFNRKQSSGELLINPQSGWLRAIEWAHRHCNRNNKLSLREKIQGHSGEQTQASDVQQNGKTSSSCSLEAYLNFMYYVCISTQNIDVGLDSTQQNIKVLQQVLFWIFGILSIGYSVDELKYFVIEFLYEGKLHDYIRLGFFLMYTVTRVYCLILHAFKNEKLQEVTRSMNDAAFGLIRNKLVSTFPYIVGGCSFVLAILSSLFGGLSFNTWSLEEIYNVRAYEMGHTIFIWSTTNYSNLTDKLDEEYASNINWISTTLATPEFIWTFCGCLQDFALGDLMLMSSISLFFNIDRYVKTVIKTDATGKISYTDFKRKWTEYQTIAKASDKFYETFGNLLTLYHIYNLLQFAVLLRFILIKDTAHFLFITTVIGVMKSLLTYIIAIKISDKNQICRNWVRQCAFISLGRNRQKNRKLYMEAILMLDEMKENPLGLGRDELFINKGFLITFLGMAASLFVMLTENSAENKEKC